MSPIALFVVVSAFTHASWNILAKRSAHCRHFNWYYSVGAVVLWSPFVACAIRDMARFSTMAAFGACGAKVLGEGGKQQRLIAAALIVAGVTALALG